MNVLAANWPRDDLHGTGLFGAPSADDNLQHAAAACREEGGVPAAQSLGGDGLIVFLGGIERHIADALDVSFDRRERTDIDAESAGYRRPHLVAVEDFAFDLARLDDVLGERLERGFSLQIKAETFHLAEQAALLVTHLGQPRRELIRAPLELRPIRLFVDIRPYSLHPM